MCNAMVNLSKAGTSCYSYDALRRVQHIVYFGMQMKPKEQVTLEPYERDHAMVVGVFRPPAKAKA